jgi:carbonic anhydrase/acetyltransferase-like protein (isoleucine patch superfamily)
MSIYSYKSSSPVIDPDSYVNEDATVIGTCIIGPGSSVWPGAVIRADNDTVSIGENVNVQDGAVIHVDIGHPATLHNGVSIGHMAMVHGATIGENTLVGMQAVVLNDAVIGKNCIIGANAVVTSGTLVPDNSLVIGSPGKIIRQVTDDEVQGNMRNALHYKQKSVDYKTYLVKLL